MSGLGQICTLRLGYLRTTPSCPPNPFSLSWNSNQNLQNTQFAIKCIICIPHLQICSKLLLTPVLGGGGAKKGCFKRVGNHIGWGPWANLYARGRRQKEVFERGGSLRVGACPLPLWVLSVRR